MKEARPVVMASAWVFFRELKLEEAEHISKEILLPFYWRHLSEVDTE